jgi:hypothetical protein
MKTTFIALSLLATLHTSAVIAATVLNPAPVPSEPCTLIPLPNGGSMCAPKFSQRVNVAPRVEFLEDIRTSSIDNAKRLCLKLKGTHVVPIIGQVNEWQCLRRIPRRKAKLTVN